MKKLLLMVLLLLGAAVAAQADTLSAGPAGSGLPSLTEVLSTAQPGDVIQLGDGVYDQNREAFPLLVDKAVTLCPAPGASPVIVTPAQTTAMKITGAGACVRGLRFDHIRCAIWILADDVTVADCAITLTDEAWRTSSCGLWLAGARRAALTDNVFSGCGLAVAGPPISESSVGIPVLTAMFEVGEDTEFFTTHTVENNTVNGRPLVYLVGVRNQRWSQSAGQLVAVQCQDVIFDALNVEKASIGVQIAYCSRITLNDCQASDNGIFGLYIMKTDGCVIRNSRADRGAHGIDVRDADRVLITDCVTNECGQGTFLSWGRNCLVQRCEIVNNGTGFFTASGGDNHVDACRIEKNELGLYVQHEALFSLTDTRVNANSACALRATDSGVISLGNLFADNFVGSLALDCHPLTYMGCTFTNNADCDLLIRQGQSVKLVNNTHDGALTDHVNFVHTDNYLYAE